MQDEIRDSLAVCGACGGAYACGGAFAYDGAFACDGAYVCGGACDEACGRSVAQSRLEPWLIVIIFLL